MSQPNILKEFVEPADLRRHIFDTEFRLVDTLILATLSKNPAHGYGLQAQIENFSFGRVSLGSASIYRTLRRMCRDGLIVPLAKEPGERTRYYDITQAGRNQLGRDLALLRRLLKAFDLGQL